LNPNPEQVIQSIKKLRL